MLFQNWKPNLILLQDILSVPMGAYHPWSDFTEDESVEQIKKQINVALATGAGINDKDLFGNSILHRLLKCDHSVIIHFLDFLLDKGADANLINDDLHNALHSFLSLEVKTKEESQFQFVPDVLLPRISDIQKRGGVPLKSDGMTLMMQDNSDFLKIIEVLMARLRDINQRNGNDDTPCMIAYRKKLRCASFIAAKGGILDYDRGIDSFGMTPLHTAIMFWDEHVIRALLAGGAIIDLKIQDNAGRTPLHIAAQKKKLAVMELLLNAGANPKTRDNGGKTAAQTLR